MHQSEGRHLFNVHKSIHLCPDTTIKTHRVTRATPSSLRTSPGNPTIFSQGSAHCKDICHHRMVCLLQTLTEVASSNMYFSHFSQHISNLTILLGLIVLVQFLYQLYFCFISFIISSTQNQKYLGRGTLIELLTPSEWPVVTSMGKCPTHYGQHHLLADGPELY